MVERLIKPTNLGEAAQQMKLVASHEARVDYVRAMREWAAPDVDTPISNIGSNMRYFVSEMGLSPEWYNAYLDAFPTYRASDEEKALPVTSDNHLGMIISRVCASMVTTATATGEQQRVDFNDVRIVANPGMSLDEVEAQYQAGSLEGACAYEIERRRIKRIRDAAPDLLEALEGLADDYATINPKYHNTDVYAAARAAIAKAKSNTGDGE